MIISAINEKKISEKIVGMILLVSDARAPLSLTFVVGCLLSTVGVWVTPVRIVFSTLLTQS